MKLLSDGVAWAAEVSRPARRRVTPRRFKEWYINHALATYGGPTYLEIGVRDGESFRIAKAARKVGVDPVRTAEMENLRPGEEFFNSTSDDFRVHAPTALSPGSVDVALIDGLHEFRQVAKDFFNLERYMRNNGIVFLDDFNPRTRARASERPEGGAWNGDVWKLAPLLSRARPDLQFWTVDADEGVGIVVGFGHSANTDLQSVTDECKLLTYRDLERNRASLLHLVSPQEFGSILAQVR